MKDVIKGNVNTIVKASTTYSDLVGSASAIIRNYFKNTFPKNYIKSFYISTKNFSDEIEDEDVFRKEKPIMMLKPNVDFSGESSVMGRMATWHYANDFTFRPMKYYYMRVLYDDANKCYIYSSHERFKLNFDINIRFSNRLQAINGTHYFKSMVRQKMYFYLENVYLETTLPKKLIATIGEYYNLNLENECDLAKLNNYLNEHSNYQIMVKKSQSSSISNYYFRFKTRLTLILNDYPTLDDGNTSGQVETDFTMSTNLEVEFNAPNIFFLELGKFVKVQELEGDEEKELIMVSLPKSEIPDPVIDDVMKMVVWQGYIIEDPKEDILDLKDVLDEDLNTIIDTNNKIDSRLNDEMFMLKLFKDDEEVLKDNFYIDWKEKKLINKNASLDYTYYIALYLDITKGKTMLTEGNGNTRHLNIVEKTIV